MSDLLAGGLLTEEGSDSSPALAEETGPLSPEAEEDGHVHDLEGISLHVNYGESKGQVVLSLLAAKTVLSVLRSVNFPTAAAMLQVGIAMQELEKGILAIEPSTGFPQKMTRAERRRMLKG